MLQLWSWVFMTGVRSSLYSFWRLYLNSLIFHFFPPLQSAVWSLALRPLLLLWVIRSWRTSAIEIRQLGVVFLSFYLSFIISFLNTLPYGFHGWSTWFNWMLFLIKTYSVRSPSHRPPPSVTSRPSSNSNKTLLFTFTGIHHLTCRYLSNLLLIPTPPHSLRSSSGLHPPPSSSSPWKVKPFSRFTLWLCHSRPPDLRSPDSLPLFKSQTLKSYC